MLKLPLYRWKCAGWAIGLGLLIVASCAARAISAAPMPPYHDGGLRPYPTQTSKRALRSIYRRVFRILTSDDRVGLTYFIEHETAPEWSSTLDPPDEQFPPVSLAVQIRELRDRYVALWHDTDPHGKPFYRLSKGHFDTTSEQSFPMGFLMRTGMMAHKEPVNWLAAYKLDNLNVTDDRAAVTYHLTMTGHGNGQDETITAYFCDTWKKTPQGWRWTLAVQKMPYVCKAVGKTNAVYKWD